MAKKKRANNTQPPRTREGQTYPGGKPMRRALRRLAEATLFYQRAIGGGGGKGGKSKGSSAYTQPGAMKP